MRKEVPIILLLLIFFGGCCSYQELVPKVKMECLSNGLIIFNQDGIYYIPKDSCCFIQESDKDIDGLILKIEYAQILLGATNMKIWRD